MKGKPYQGVRVGSEDRKWNDTGLYQWGTWETSLGVGPINRTGDWSSELCYT